MKPNTVQCVIAWTEETAEWDGEPYAVDLGERPGMRPVTKARAAMWLNEATPADVAKAQAYAAAEGGRVYTFSGERDPLGAARRAVLADANRPSHSETAYTPKTAGCAKAASR